ncbi:hypothetical protein DFH09DRAFT_1291947 [Mycena vulgaris]|nr:hypothetical protein DFH09DRAFT_1291947 [Mycena vulgaris]
MTKPKPKPRTAPTATKRPQRKSRAKKVELAEASSDIEEVVPSGRAQRTKVNWVKNPEWTDLLVSYLVDNPTFRIKLFSDSTAEAKKEKRAKAVAKDGKAIQYGELAKHIFAEDPSEQVRYVNDPTKYALSVETRLRRLKKEYQAKLVALGATGAGLDPVRIREGTALASLIDEIRQDWSWWDDLHAFWRELPNYNPIGVQSSEPGIDHVSAAADLFDAQEAASDAASDADSDAEPIDLEVDLSKGQDGNTDTGGDDKSHSSSSDSDDDDLDGPFQASSPHLRPKTPPPAPAKKPKETKGKTKAPAALSGRDLGLAKAAAARSSGAAKKKPQNAIDRLNDLREGESTRLAEKRKLQHREEMERIKIKRMKYELKMLQAQNERTRLNRHATSQSPRRSSRMCNIGSPSPSKSRSTRYSVASPRHVAFNLPVPSYRPTFGDIDRGTDAATNSDRASMSEFSGIDFDFSSVASTSSGSAPDWALPPVGSWA